LQHVLVVALQGKHLAPKSKLLHGSFQYRLHSRPIIFICCLCCVFVARYQQLLGSCAGLLEDLLQLHTAAASQHPAAAAALAAGSQPGEQQQQQQQAAGAAAGRKRSHAAASASDQQPQQAAGAGGLGEALWAQVEGAVTGLAPFRDAALDKWHRRTVLSSGGAALSGNSLRALQQGVSKQVATLLADPTKVVRRSQLPVSLAPRPLGALPQQQQRQQASTPGAAGLDVAGGEDDRDAETYDDGDFYQQLLKELLESSGEGARAAAGARAPKRRKVVDRRASKGRKIRWVCCNPLGRETRLVQPQLLSHSCVCLGAAPRLTASIPQACVQLLPSHVYS
jgi:protein AATF/BFR2